MFINHSRDHEENKYECEECKWCFESYARLHGHCRSTHDTMKFSCDTCGEDFSNNEDLYRHVTRKHILICHVCRNTFVSESELQGHLEECHGEKTPRTREQMIEDEQAEEHLKKQRRREERRRKRKRRRRGSMMMTMMMMTMMGMRMRCTIPRKTMVMTALSTQNIFPPRNSSGMLTKKETDK